MNCVIPFNKKIKFNTSISEITSISLEHEITFNKNALLGNFMLTGDYKTHEVSVNNTPFSYTIPFDVSIPDNINEETLSFEIENFTYEVLDNNTLNVNIEFRVVGDEEPQPVKFATVSDNDIQNPLELIDETITRNLEVETNDQEVEQEHEIIEEVKEPKLQTKIEEVNNERVNEVSESKVLNIANNSDETFVTYHIHIVSNGENVESICNLYNINQSLLTEYNDLNNVQIGEKLIIPIDE